MLFVILIVLMLVSFYISNKLKRKFEEYSQIKLSNGMSGKQAAEMMLRQNGIYDVQILSVEGKLSDHYNPLEKTVNLSHDVYYGQHAAAVAVAAHEVGHAVQHATGYAWLRFRSAMAPTIMAGSKIFPFAIIGAMFLAAVSYEIGLISIFLVIGIQALITIFSLITLPVEYDASNRALKWMTTNGVVTTAEHEMAADALKWAARTYLVAAISAVVTLLYYIMIFFGRGRD